jgi:hypothetical protein
MNKAKQPGRKRVFREPRRFGGVCEAAELAEWKRAAAGVPLSAYIRAAVNEKVKGNHNG